MPAPHRLRVEVDDLAVSAFVLPPIDGIEGQRPVCKHCAPRKTRLSQTVEVRIPLKDGWLVYHVYTCEHCLKSWALQWLVLKNEVST